MSNRPTESQSQQKLGHVRQESKSNSSASRSQNMRLHFEIFSKDYWVDDNNQPVRKPNGSHYKFHEICKEHINDAMVGTFATYLTKHAVSQGHKRNNNNNDRPLLSLSSTIQYFSSFKNDAKDLFPNETFPCFDSDRTKMNNSAIQRSKIQHFRKNNIPVTQKI